MSLAVKPSFLELAECICKIPKLKVRFNATVTAKAKFNSFNKVYYTPVVFNIYWTFTGLTEMHWKKNIVCHVTYFVGSSEWMMITV